MKRTFTDVVTNIKKGEVWRNKYTKIYLNSDGEVVIKDINYFKNNDIRILEDRVVINLNSGFWLES